MTSLHHVLAGFRTGIPVALGYLPAAFAFGAAASGLGLGTIDATLIAAFVYSGASQAFLISALAAGMPAVMVFLLCGAMSLRHLLYGWVLRDRLTIGLGARLTFAYGLTDEVFGTALPAAGRRQRRLPGGWLVGLAGTAWTTWVLGTLIGAEMGDILKSTNALLADAMTFALPALFVGLVLASVTRALLLPMALAAGISGALVLLDMTAIAIPAGAGAALLVGRIRK